METHCIYCQHKFVYILKNGHIKCAKCKKKYSLERLARRIKIINGFCEGLNAYVLADKLSLNYITVTNEYKIIRILISNFLQNEFEKHESYISEYDEYLYIPQNKKASVEAIFEAKNFLIFDYGKIYTTMLPFVSKYKTINLEPKELKKFLSQNKIAKLTQQENTINKFCNFFEKEIKKYKGIKEENFSFYLKEIEFRFNYSIKQRYDIAIKLMYDSIAI
ncbi:transposase [Arcobacter sp. FWKO B]|uniref:transposase n=1 Tax=Arcobacter sp. FWKO B TaxID=2593672 RepID=UPI0018A69253|nr:transposase [Arcobacter sp. FWKO B]QOG11988.1 transposase [Arcobacter sp. FWKO B]